MNATTTFAPAGPQYMRALERANEVRLARAELKRRVAFGEIDVAKVIVECPWETHTMAVFDAIVNNADRKGGHLLPTVDGHINGVDHGVCFSVDDKLRTVLWRWRGRPLTDEAIDCLSGLRAQFEGELGAVMRELLDPDEVAATIVRVDRLLSTRRHPLPSDDWPPVPWPPF